MITLNSGNKQHLDIKHSEINNSIVLFKYYSLINMFNMFCMRQKVKQPDTQNMAVLIKYIQFKFVELKILFNKLG